MFERGSGFSGASVCTAFSCYTTTSGLEPDARLAARDQAFVTCNATLKTI
jgi:hypothetical protein